MRLPPTRQPSCSFKRKRRRKRETVAGMPTDVAGEGASAPREAHGGALCTARAERPPLDGLSSVSRMVILLAAVTVVEAQEEIPPWPTLDFAKEQGMVRLAKAYPSQVLLQSLV